jgi:hypothetical protein
MYEEELPTVLNDALTTLGLYSIKVSTKRISEAFKVKTVSASLEVLTKAASARRLLNKFIRYGSFNFNCANCHYLTKWTINLYIEINGVLLCPTCQRGIENILENNPTFKRQADIDREAIASIKAAELEAAYEYRMSLRRKGLL